MNMIPCDQDCVNQVEGYCNLAGITSLKESTEKGCLYYQKGSPVKDPHLAADIPERFGNGTQTN